MYIIQRPFNGFPNRLTGFKVMTNLYAKFYWNRTCDLEKKVWEGFHFCPQPQGHIRGKKKPRPNWVEYELYLH